jgi:hypothetical protein
MRKLVLALALAVSLTGCWEKRIKHLDDAEFRHYYSLKVYLDEDQRKSYLKMKTREERDAFLQGIEMPGRPPRILWNMYYDYDEHIREKIYSGEVQKGWTTEMLLMAWGKPLKQRKLAGRQASRSWAYIYKFEQHEDGSVLVWEPGSKTEYKAEKMFKREVIIDDDVIANIRNK